MIMEQGHSPAGSQHAERKTEKKPEQAAASENTPQVTYFFQADSVSESFYGLPRIASSCEPPPGHRCIERLETSWPLIVPGSTEPLGSHFVSTP